LGWPHPLLGARRDVLIIGRPPSDTHTAAGGAAALKLKAEWCKTRAGNCRAVGGLLAGALNSGCGGSGGGWAGTQAGPCSGEAAGAVYQVLDCGGVVGMPLVRVSALP